MMQRPSVKNAYSQQPDDGQDPYQLANDSNGSDPNAPQQPQSLTAERRQSFHGDPHMQRPEQRRTFAQMRDEGYARPPAPAIQAIPPAPQMPSVPAMSPAPAPPTPMMVTDSAPPPPAVAPAAAAPQAPSSADAILALLTGGAQGTNKTPLQTATDQKLLAQLNGSSPYDSQAVRDEYSYLAGNIDDDYVQQQRALLNADAQRGLYGSVGKDFESGRLADLNVGQRSAKISLAQDLANKYATSKGQYDANAISQAQAGTNADDANRRSWLAALMGYGDDAFNHDLATAQFQQRQNESEQDYLLRLLNAGYGV